MTRHVQTTLPVHTHGKGFYPIGGCISRWLDELGPGVGIITIFCRHTSASLTIQENADSDVLKDLSEFFERLIPGDSDWIRHKMEGSDDMPAHIRTALTDTTLSIPTNPDGILLGTWQDIYLIEHRSLPHSRTLILHYSGE
jgi:secondary thiamine-phosphate synthase enzyme